MKRNLHKNHALIFIFLFVFLVTSLISCKGKTDEDLIQALMKKIGSYAEEKDAPSIMLDLADDYFDFEGRRKKETEEMIKEYFRQYKGIVIHVLSTRIDEISLPEASIQTDVALSSGAAKVFRKLVRLSTDNYRLKIKLIKRDSEWKIRYSEWQYISLDELFPESLSIFKRIFKTY